MLKTGSITLTIFNQLIKQTLHLDPEILRFIEKQINYLGKYLGTEKQINYLGKYLGTEKQINCLRTDMRIKR